MDGMTWLPAAGFAAFAIYLLWDLLHSFHREHSPHVCAGSLHAHVTLRRVDYGDRNVWQLDLGRTALFDIRHCPYCGASL